MRKAALLAAFATASILSVPVTANAAEWYRAPAQRFTGSPSTVAQAFLHAHAPQLRIQNVELKERRVLALGNLHTVRFVQRHHGLPVVGKSVAVRVGPEGSVHVAVADIARGLTVSTTPNLDEAAAKAQVFAYAGIAPEHVAATELVVLPYEEQGGLLVWHVDVALAHGMHRFVVDAHGGGVMQNHPLSRHALGRVYDVNPLTTPTLVDRELGSLDPLTPQSLTGHEGGLRVYGYTSGDLSYGEIEATQLTGPNEGEDFLYEPNPVASSLDDPFGEVMSYYHASRIREYFETTHALDMSGNEYSLAIVASYAPSSSPEYIENAFYSPWSPGYESFPGSARNIICLGRGYSDDFAYDSDVLLHEFTHYISNNALDYTSTGYYDQYGMVMMPDAINEGTADYFSSTLNNDPIVGEFALGGYARNLTELPGACPDAVLGESHEDGRLIGSAGWAIRGALGVELADQVVWGAMSLLNANASLGEFGQGVMQTAADLELDATQVDAIEAILAERGLDDCGRSLETKDKPRNSYLIGLDVIGQYMGFDCQQAKGYGISLTSIFQFSYTPNPSDTSVELAVQLQNVMGSGALDWNIYVRRGEMVTFSGGGGYNPPSVSEYDYAAENLTTSSGSVVIDETSDPPFDPQDTYYMVIAHQNCPMTSMQVEARSGGIPTEDAGPDAPVEEDAGPIGVDAGTDSEVPQVDANVPPIDGGGTGNPADASEPGGGCGCRTTGTGTTGGAAALFALAVGMLLRRRKS